MENWLYKDKNQQVIFFFNLIARENFPKYCARPKTFQNKYQWLFPWLPELLHSSRTVCVFSNFSTSLKKKMRTENRDIALTHKQKEKTE